jgi:hypothetical protein
LWDFFWLEYRYKRGKEWEGKKDCMTFGAKVNLHYLIPTSYNWRYFSLSSQGSGGLFALLSNKDK